MPHEVVLTRRAKPCDAEAIASAHRDSIRSIGPGFYPPDVVEHGARTVQIQASLAGVEFYKSNGFAEIGRGEAMLMSGQTMVCVFMRKRLQSRRIE